MEKVIDHMKSHSGEEKGKIILCLVIQKYTPLEGNQSNLIQTGWTLMGLLHSGQVSL